MMALTNCPECDGQVSTDALACPNCGHSLTGAIPQSQSMRQGDGAEVNKDDYLLEVFVRSNWFDHYQDRFMRFLHEDRPPISWHWPRSSMPRTASNAARASSSGARDTFRKFNPPATMSRARSRQ